MDTMSQCLLHAVPVKPGSKLAYGLHPGKLPTGDDSPLERYEYELFVVPQPAIHRGTLDSYGF